MSEKKEAVMDLQTVKESSQLSLQSTKEDGHSKGPIFDEKRTKNLVRKMDRNIVPFLSLLYLLSFLDRTNIGNARLVNLEDSLGMTGLDYNVALAIFFPFYVAAEVPSNVMLKRTSASFWFSFIMVFWAISTTLMGLVKTYPQLLAVRAVLGLWEGGLFPGINFYITTWYRRHECGLRMAIFFSAATAAGAFGGLIARGVSEMKGIGGLQGWSWIFILEGIVTFIVAIWAYFQVHDKPETAKFLTEEERSEVRRRLVEDRHNLADEWDMKYVWQALKDWKIWVHMLITFGMFICLYSISLFLPTIIKNMGYKNNDAQLMTVPPYVVGCIFTISGGFLADRYKQRGVFMIGYCIMAMTGFSMLLATESVGVQYAGTFLATSGIYANIPGGVAWNGNNIGGSTKRAIGLGLHASAGNLGGIVSSFLFLSSQSPRYLQGFGTLLAVSGMSCILSIIMTIYLRRENTRRDREGAEKGLPTPENYTEEMREAEREKGDDASFFRYVI
ncbi:hypothetical protein M408DRAFT_152128 [Serendipita vermifera MAFF 305830]|uniref:Major facilitator superfamily (MFS) profile domain-containing protein n=1 Tax=Serendipita vermifera MAFF 305830 TaxID=933852 RepID=A0A0C3B8Y8_SERVB|nr:hypothetical protein M408DRAFT_152128 [Serendipita vermifera MAFF 305830]